jgi:hypothetical protein
MLEMLTMRPGAQAAGRAGDQGDLSSQVMHGRLAALLLPPPARRRST